MTCIPFDVVAFFAGSFSGCLLLVCIYGIIKLLVSSFEVRR